MRRPALSVGGWFAAACLLASAAWSCSSGDTNPFGDSNREQGGSGGTSGVNGSGMSGSSSGTDSGSSGSGGTSGASTGGEATGGMTTGGSTGDGGAAADSGNDSGGTASGGAGMGGTSGPGGAGMGGKAGTPATGGAGAAGAPTAGAGMGGGAGTMGGMSGSGGMPGGCEDDSGCADDEYCKKASCDAAKGECQERGPECVGYDAEFDPLCGCDGITYWNTCVIEHDGVNVARAGECTDDDDRPTCTRTGGADSCPARSNAHCYRPVEVCGDPSPMNGVCWVLPAECPDFEPQTQRYCGGTAGEARCIGLCEVIDAENSFRRDAPTCD